MNTLTDKIEFVTGIDTDAGKTYATGWYARSLIEQGLRVATMKFIQTGCTDYSDDLLLHRRIMQCDIPEDSEGLTAPEIYTYPASPHLSAAIDNRPVDLEKIWRAALTLAERYDRVLIEGAGGPMVPVAEDYLTIDFPIEHHLPVILVTNSRLGSISHTLLSLEAISARGLQLSAMLYNRHFDDDPVISPDTHRYIKRFVATHYPEAAFIDIPSIPHA